MQAQTEGATDAQVGLGRRQYRKALWFPERDSAWGVDKIFVEKPDYILPTVHAVGNYSTELWEPEFGELRETENMEEQVCTLVRQMVEDAQGNDVLMRHLLAGILYVKGSQSRLIVDMENRILHPSQSVPEFDILDDHSGYSLKRYREFLERG